MPFILYDASSSLIIKTLKMDDHASQKKWGLRDIMQINPILLG